MGFYDNFIELCNVYGTYPSRVAEDIGLTKSAVTKWKNRGTTPTDVVLYKIADYFNISVDELLNGKQKEPAEADSELDEILQAVRDNPSLKMLFSASKNATPEDINRTVAILERLKGTNNDL